MVDGPTYEQRWDAGTVAAIALAVGWFPVRANDGARVEAMVGAALEAAGVPGLLAELETARTQRDDAQAQAERMTRIVLGEDLEELEGHCVVLTAALTALVEDCAPGPGEGHIPNAPSERTRENAVAVLAAISEETPR